MELQTVSKYEYETMSAYAQFISDNMNLILKKIIQPFNNIQLITQDLTFLTNNKNCEIEYYFNTFSLANTKNFENIISKIKQYKNLQAYIPKSEDPICKTFHSRISKYNKENNSIITSFITSLTADNNNIQYIIIPMSIWCNYNIENYNNQQEWIFEENHANLLIINKKTLECTILDPHGPLTNSKKTKSIITEFNKNIPSKYNIKFINNHKYKINHTKCTIEGEIQGQDYLCTTWVCYILYEILNNNTKDLNHKYKSIANMLNLLISTCEPFKKEINTYIHSNEYIKDIKFVPKRYIKIYKSLYTNNNL